MSVFPLKEVAGARVLVVGDVMLDRYWFGDAYTARCGVGDADIIVAGDPGECAGRGDAAGRSQRCGVSEDSAQPALKCTANWGSWLACDSGVSDSASGD